MRDSQETSIPTVDLSAFLSNDDKQRQTVAKQLTEACHDLGFVYITGHGISTELLSDAFEWSRMLFDLSHEDKMKAPHPPGPIPHRGYSHPGLEKVYSKQEANSDAVNESQGSSLRKIKDFKESYEIGSEHNPAQPNIWLPEKTFPGFQAFMTKFYWELNITACNILRAICLGLDLTADETDYLFKIHTGHNNQLRLLHYPPVLAEQAEISVIARMPAHSDWSSFTMLFQDDCDGLELENPKNPGEFLSARPMPGACVVNIGDMLERITNDTFPSATHRVTLPPLQLSQGNGSNTKPTTRARYSIPYFVAPDGDAIIHCLPSRVDKDHPKAYEDVKYSDYGGMRSKYQYQGDV